MDPAQLDLANLLRWVNGDSAKREFDSYIAGKVPPLTMDNALAMSQIGG